MSTSIVINFKSYFANSACTLIQRHIISCNSSNTPLDQQVMMIHTFERYWGRHFLYRYQQRDTVGLQGRLVIMCIKDTNSTTSVRKVPMDHKALLFYLFISSSKRKYLKQTIMMKIPILHRLLVPFMNTCL